VVVSEVLVTGGGALVVMLVLVAPVLAVVPGALAVVPGVVALGQGGVVELAGVGVLLESTGVPEGAAEDAGCPGGLVADDDETGVGCGRDDTGVGGVERAG
jgi:hypothetical protein